MPPPERSLGWQPRTNAAQPRKLPKMPKSNKNEPFAATWPRNKGEISEKHLTAAEKELFLQAKVKELQSFFENGVWEFSTSADAIPERTLTSRILLKWSKNTDGTPRAKARLVVRGFNDVDALNGNLDTASPTTSRLSRSILLTGVFMFAMESLGRRCVNSILARTSTRTSTMASCSSRSSTNPWCSARDPHVPEETCLWTVGCTT